MKQEEDQENVQKQTKE